MPSITEQILTLEKLKDIAQQRLTECMASDPDCKLQTTQQFKNQVQTLETEIAELKEKAKGPSTRVWAAKCKNPKCGRLSGLRYSQTIPNLQIEIPNPSRTTEVQCPYCGHRNVFSDAELTEVNATVLGG